MSLKRLLEDRAKHKYAGIERQKGGTEFFFTHTDHNAGRCTYCWKAPGDGYAIVEIWGAGGSGGKMCCCSPPGLPGNPGAYVKKKIRVCSSTYVCGAAGCAPPGNGLCYSGRSNCTFTCYFNQGESCCVMRAMGGYGGWIQCHTSNGGYCCYRKCLYCVTNTNTCRGIVCNHCGVNGSRAACACGGDVCIPGGISCTFYHSCCARCHWCFEHTIALPGGYHSYTGAPCIRYRREYNAARDGARPANIGRPNYHLATSGFAGGYMNNAYTCFSSDTDCGCYDITYCQLSTPGFAGQSGAPCNAVRAGGMRGGMGAVRITYYEYNQNPFGVD